LNLWDDGGKFLFCDFLRYLFHFCPVFCGSAAVKVLCAAVANAAVFCDEMVSAIINQIFHYFSCSWRVGFGIG
jgi:hypothetical protein